MKHYLVISALGEDRPGIVNEISMTIYDAGCNIVDSRMTILGGEFALILMISGDWNEVAKVESSLPAVQEKLGMTIISKRTELPGASQNLLPYSVEVVTMDHPGVVHSVAEFFSSRNINIADMYTGSYAAAHTGTAMFTLNMTVSIPAEIHIAELREQFMDFCDSLNLDAVIEPIKG